MNHTKSIVLVAAFVACCVLALGQPSSGAEGPKPLETDVYAVKFVCGTTSFEFLNTEGPVTFGDYRTAINVHNPNGASVAFRKKAILLYRADQPPTVSEVPVPPYPFHFPNLPPNWGLEIDCNDIRNVLLHPVGPPDGLPQAPPFPTFIKGWVVIEVQAKKDPPPLDVTAVYTTQGQFFGPQGGGVALEIKSVLPKRVTKQ